MSAYHVRVVFFASHVNFDLLTMSSKKKRICLSVNDKKFFLKEVDARVLTKTEIAKKYGIPKNSLSTIIKARQKIIAVGDAGGGVAPSRKYFREAKFPELEKALVAWLRKMRSKNVPIDGNLLKEQADLFASKMALKDFKGSDGWLQKFKLRHGLSFRKICGESAAVDTSVTNEWKEKRLKSLLSEYLPEDIFNADESGLFYKVLPAKTLVFKGDTCSGGKKAKQRITVLLGANMTGSEKLPLLFIGNYKKPRCFKNVKKLPSAYYANKKAWMTSEIYTKWLRELDRHFSQNKRKILLVVDNCTAHVEVTGLQAIRVEFLPPNVTSVLQPMDQGIIHCFKRKYRGMLLKRVILNLELEKHYEIDVLSAMHLSISAWNDVSQATIANSFRHAGFIKGSVQEIPKNDSDLSADEALIQELRRRDPQVPENLTFHDFLTVDENVQACTEEVSDDEIINQVLNGSDNEQSDEEEECAEVIPRPTIKEATEWLSGLRRFFEADNNFEMLNNINSMESYVYRSAIMKQTKIDDFFVIANE